MLFSTSKGALALLFTLVLFFNLLIPFTAVGASTEQSMLFSAVNEYRERNGKAILGLDSGLSARAQAYAEDMAKRDYISHTSPDGATLDRRMAGYSDSVGENLATGQSDPSQVVKDWANSPEHNANMLGANFKAMGVGYAYNAQSKYKHFWVQILGAKDVVSQATQPTQPAQEPTQPTQPVEQPQPIEQPAQPAERTPVETPVQPEQPPAKTKQPPVQLKKPTPQPEEPTSKQAQPTEQTEPTQPQSSALQPEEEDCGTTIVIVEPVEESYRIVEPHAESKSVGKLRASAEERYRLNGFDRADSCGQP